MGSYLVFTTNGVEISIRVTSGQISGVFLFLILFGILYNHLVGWMETKGYLEGYLSFSVVLGVMGTLAGLAFISWPAAILGLICFIGSGLPMIIGSVGRYIQQRAEDQQRLLNELRQHDN